MPQIPATQPPAIVAPAPSQGFALAAGEISSGVIVTDSAGLVTAEAAVSIEDRAMPVYFARPEGDGPFPVILVVHEIFGLHEHIRDVARRLAKLGFLAIAPELFFRYGDPSKVQDVQSLVREIVGKVPDAEVFAELDATLAFAGRIGGDVGRAGITGFCWGGRITWLYAAHNPSLSAGVAWYGRLDGERTDRTPRFPVDIGAVSKVPVLGIYGGADPGIPQASVERMRAALKSGGSPSEIIVYPDAPHAFFADYRQSYRQEAARDGWTRLLAWLEAHGLRPGADPARAAAP